MSTEARVHICEMMMRCHTQQTALIMGEMAGSFVEAIHLRYEEHLLSWNRSQLTLKVDMSVNTEQTNLPFSARIDSRRRRGGVINPKVFHR